VNNLQRIAFYLQQILFLFIVCFFFGSVVIGVAFLSDLLASSAFYSPLRKENKNKKMARLCWCCVRVLH